jgi:hypothetical protein
VEPDWTAGISMRPILYLAAKIPPRWYDRCSAMPMAVGRDAMATLARILSR